MFVGKPPSALCFGDFLRFHGKGHLGTQYLTCTDVHYSFCDIGCGFAYYYCITLLYGIVL